MIKEVTLDEKQVLNKYKYFNKIDQFYIDIIKSNMDLDKVPKGSFKMPKRNYKPIIKEAYRHIDIARKKDRKSKTRFKSVPTSYSRASLANLKINQLFKKEKKRVIWKDIKENKEKSKNLFENNLLEFYTNNDKSKESTTIKSENISNTSNLKIKIGDDNIKFNSSEKVVPSQPESSSEKTKKKLKGIVKNHFLDFNDNYEHPQRGIRTVCNSPIKKKKQLLLNFKGNKIMDNKKFIKKIKKQFNLQIDKVKSIQKDKNFFSKNN